MRRYESYKDSGVEWLGEVPSHWNLIPNKYIFKLRKNVVGKRSNEYDLLSLSLKGVIKRDMENPEGKFPAEFDTYQEVKEGDFIFCLFDVEETPRTVGLSSYHGMITGAYTIFETNNVDKKFIYYFYLNLDSDKRLKPLYKGLRNTISKETFFSFNTFIPPLSEQQKIAQFLDEKTAKIDQAVDLAEKQIALLKEHKQILIQNAVTRGLNPDVPLKDSGVEWIGQVPEHWEVKQLKFEAHITLGKMLCTEYKRGFHLKPYLKSKNIQWLNVDTSSIDEMYFSSYELALYKLEKGDLILSEGGEVGKTCMWNNELDECYIQNSAHKVRLYKKNNNKYFLYLFFSCGHLGVFDSIVNRVSIAHLTKDKLENMKFIFPTLAEQTAIADYLDKQTTKIDQAIALKTVHIEKLKEYKSVLINDVVTGKVRVSV